MRPVRFVVLCGIVLLLAGCGSSAKTPAARTTTPPESTGMAAAPDTMTGQSRAMSHRVTMTEYSFSPESLNVMAGDTVVWVNKGKIAHTTTSGMAGKPDGKWDMNVGPGDSMSHVFNTAGRYPYYCKPHTSQGMKGVIIVTGNQQGNESMPGRTMGKQQPNESAPRGMMRKESAPGRTTSKPSGY